MLSLETQKKQPFKEIVTCISLPELSPALCVASVTGPYLPPEVTCEGQVFSGRPRALQCILGTWHVEVGW